MSGVSILLVPFSKALKEELERHFPGVNTYRQ